jgi:hypothetical protein
MLVSSDAGDSAALPSDTTSVLLPLTHQNDEDR